ncbi:DUF3104 domain-containing protein [Synechococcus sp. RSCCF101]|uniref:DUF3104 domain-containing protein n=1 Tax=Synechococcus sp. RSCCF101 TaxID=2511069 RepID=UPI00177BE4A8|nr:DUF3104 domain-containing protein [Synechococcus sp. RSCCF101]
MTRLSGHYEYRLSVFLDAERTAVWRQDAASRDPLVPLPTDALRQADPTAFLQVQVGDTVLIDDPEPFTAEWIGLVIHAEGGARGPENNYFQVADVDTGLVKMLSADAVVAVLEQGQQQQR